MPTAERHVIPAEHVNVQEAMLRELVSIAHLLDTRDDVADFTPAAVLVSDDQRALTEQRDWPMRGGRRYLIGRQGFGLQAVMDGTVQQLLSANAGRIGGVISVPTGPVTLYLADRKVVATAGGQPNTEAVPQIVLPTGAQWNFKLGDVLWGGSVCASGAGGTFVSVAEV